MPIFLIILLRVLVPLTILRWPLVGGLLCLYLDYIDWWLNPAFRSEGSQYQLLDKGLDIYYLSFEAFVVLSWRNTLVRTVALSLFIYRFIGVLLFVSFSYHPILFFFPNIFEHFYIFYLVYLKVRLLGLGKLAFSASNIVPILLILAIPTVVQEYFQHVLQRFPWQIIQVRGVEELLTLAYILIPASLLFVYLSKPGVKRHIVKRKRVYS